VCAFILALTLLPTKTIISISSNWTPVWTCFSYQQSFKANHVISTPTHKESRSCKWLPKCMHLIYHINAPTKVIPQFDQILETCHQLPSYAPCGLPKSQTCVPSFGIMWGMSFLCSPQWHSRLAHLHRLCGRFPKIRLTLLTKLLWSHYHWISATCMTMKLPRHQGKTSSGSTISTTLNT
jgi:hypothetical protein